MNIATAEELQNSSCYLDIIEDTRIECSQFGTVKSIIVPRQTNNRKNNVNHNPARSNGDDGDKSIGRAFIEMGTVGEAKRVLLHLKGKQFNGQSVDIKFYPHDQYHINNYKYTQPEGSIITVNGTTYLKNTLTHDNYSKVLNTK